MKIGISFKINLKLVKLKFLHSKTSPSFLKIQTSTPRVTTYFSFKSIVGYGAGCGGKKRKLATYFNYFLHWQTLLCIIFQNSKNSKNSKFSNFSKDIQVNF